MNWIESLYQTYENCFGKIGDEHDTIPLAPYCHSDRPVHIEVILDIQGNFIRARQVPLENTIIPITEKSAGRTSAGEPHPLCDKLQYVAGDYEEFGGNKKPYFDLYITALQKWVESTYNNRAVNAVYTYVMKRCLIRDLVTHGVLYADDRGKLLKKWNGDKDKKPVFFSYFKNNSWQADSFVRWCVEVPGVDESRLWLDREVWKLWQEYYKTTISNTNLCYVMGNAEQIASSHLKRLRSNGDNAKLISANDQDGYTFRGRFTDKTGLQACGISFEVSQKAHNALRWLISRQGWRNGDLAFVAWAVSGDPIPDPMLDSLDLWESETEAIDTESEPLKNYTAQDIGKKVATLLQGYSAKLGNTDRVIVMGLNSATPGRMAITFYRDLTGSEFLERVQSWHTQCSWFQRFRKDKKFIGAPAPKDIAKTAYGNEVDAKLCNATVERIIPCIIDGLPLPLDLVESTKRRACKRQSLEPWEWEKTLGIACSLYKYFNKDKEEYTMALDHERQNRDYLYGRLLAVADCLEGFALSDAEKGRQTNAARLMQRFADHPFSTWRTIELALSPYKARLGHQGTKYTKALQDIMNLFETDDYTKDTPLSGEFLIGFHTQRTELYKKSNKPDTNNEEEVQEATL